MSSLIKYGGAASAVLAIAAVAALVGFKADRPAWSSDIILVQAQIDEVDQLATQEALDANQLRIFQNRREQEQIKTQGKSVPDYLFQEQVILEGKKDKLEKRLAP